MSSPSLLVVHGVEVFIGKGFGWKITSKSLKRPYHGGLFYHGFGIHSLESIVLPMHIHMTHGQESRVNGQRSMVNYQNTLR